MPRPRLDHLLAGVTARPLTLVIAPAGSGKTQFLSNWRSHSSAPTAWLSLEEMDDDPIELWLGLSAALDSLVPGTGEDLRTVLLSGVPLADVVRSLLDTLENTSATESVLIIDDIHHVRDPAASDSLSLFVQHLPAWLHVIMSGRTEPQLPLDRLRGRGQLTELRFADLRLTNEEACELLGRLAPELTGSEIEESVLHTDGWAAGVQLTGLAARSAQGRLAPMALQVDVQLLTEDYVWHEVLANGDPEVIDVLLQVSVLDRVNTALATAITGRSDVRSLLLKGAAQGLFVHRLGGDGWFRIHPFVREALLNELTRSSRHLGCHARAAQSLEDSGETVSALEQWLLAGQPRQALRLLGARSTELYDGGREAVLMRTVDAIPVDVAAGDVESLIDFAVGHILGSRAKFADAVRQAVWLAERTQHDFAAQLDALRAISSTMAGDWTTGGAAAVRSLRDTTTEWWTDPAVRFSWNTATRALALGERWDDDDQLVIDATIAMSRDPRRGMSLEGVRALGHALSGRPVDALGIAAGVRHAAPTMTILRVELALAEAIARRELGDRDRALAELRELADETDEPRLYVPVSARLELALAASEEGDSERAVGELARAEALVTDNHGGADLSEWLHSVSSSIASDAGRIEDAIRSAQAIEDPFWGPVARSRVRIVLGDLPAAAEQLADAEPRCVRHRVVLGLLSARLASRHDDVLDHVTVAVGEASAHGMLQTVVAYGRELMDVIERAAWAVPEEWLQRLRLAMTPSEIRLHLPAREFVEPLTNRERDVLRLLPSRLTLTEIAKELYVSVNTLKFHLRVIYRKLGVNSREEAAAIARSRVAASSPSGHR